MDIEINKNNDSLYIGVSGRVDTVTAPRLDTAIKDNIEGIKELTLDFKELIYISSAGLRVLLIAQKQMKKQGEMKIINVSAPIKEVFEMTGFADILDIR